jgi:RNA polymerase sigma-70 factor, ECF subfamily
MDGATLAGRHDLSDEEVVSRVLAGDTRLFEIIMRRYNRRLFRVARAILRDDGEAEDVMQDAYVRAYQNLRQFAGRARFSTWLTRIAAHEAISRARRRKRHLDLHSVLESSESSMDPPVSRELSPLERSLDRELADHIEASVEALPEIYRVVFTLREIEGMSTAETAELLGISEEAAKVRLHRSRALVRKGLEARSGKVARGEIFRFHLSRCDRVVKRVLEKIAAIAPAGEMPDGGR